MRSCTSVYIVIHSFSLQTFNLVSYVSALCMHVCALCMHVCGLCMHVCALCMHVCVCVKFIHLLAGCLSLQGQDGKDGNPGDRGAQVRLLFWTAQSIHHRLITWLITWSQTDHMTGHRLITWAQTDHRLITWLITWAQTDHRLITWAQTDHRLVTDWSHEHRLTTWSQTDHWLITWSQTGHWLITWSQTDHMIVIFFRVILVYLDQRVLQVELVHRAQRSVCYIVCARFTCQCYLGVTWEYILVHYTVLPQYFNSIYYTASP